MPVVVLVGVAAVLSPLLVLACWPSTGRRRTTATTRRNLTRGLFAPTVDIGSLESRRSGAGAVLRALTPEGSARRVRRLRELAGRPEGWTMSRLLWAKVGLVVAVLGIAALTVAESPGPLWLAVVLAAAVALYYLPELLLWSRAQEREQAITRELPDTLDQMTIAVEAGLGFDAALSRAASNGTGPLALELSRTLQDISVGRPRRDAFLALVQRTQVPDLQRFVSAINQADAYGISVAGVLRVQADEMRLKRRQRAEEKAMKVPVKVVFPLMLCILPATMVVVLGPAIISLGSSLG
jgi:tight adherence protein C